MLSTIENCFSKMEQIRLVFVTNDDPIIHKQGSTTNIFSVWKWPFTISVVWEMAIHNLRGLGHPNSQKPLVTLGEPRKLLR